MSASIATGRLARLPRLVRAGAGSPSNGMARGQISRNATTGTALRLRQPGRATGGP